MSADLKAVSRYTGVSMRALEKLAERIEPFVIAKLFGPPEKLKPKRRS